jgi:hypothetical protein
MSNPPQPPSPPETNHAGSAPPNGKSAGRFRWLFTRRGAILSASGTVITGVLVTLIVQMLSPHVPGATKPARSPTNTPAPTPTSTKVSFQPSPSAANAVTSAGQVTLAAKAPYRGPAGSGWSLTPVTSGNDYVSVTATLDPTQACKGATSWVMPDPPEQLAPLPSFTAAAVSDWAAANGGIPQSKNYITMRIFAANHHTVVIDDFGVRIVNRAKPIGGTRATLSAGCGGLEPSFFTANLDADNPVAQPVAGRDDSGKVVPPVPLPHEITDSGPEVWRLQLTTAHCQCDYIPFFDWSSAGSSGRYDVTLRNKPWRITAATGAKSAYPSGKGWTAF